MSTWDVWMQRHATIFGLTSDQDAGMLVEWARLFDSVGFSPEEMAQATDWLALNAPPKYRTEHLAALQSRVRTARAEQQKRDQPEQPAKGCRLCDESGRVIVPSRVALRQGQVGGTEAVFCGCRLGMWFREQARDYLRERQRPGEPTTLVAYEQDVPDWPEVFERWKKIGEAERVAQGRAGNLDRLLGEIAMRIKR